MYHWQGFHPLIRTWFTQQFGQPTNIQQQAWQQIQAGQDTLISAPTGSGKTLAAMLCQLDAMLQPALDASLPDKLCVLYLSPLRALSRDIHVNLHKPLQDLAQLAGKKKLPIRTALRTGDTTPAQRATMLRTIPHLLITTPESLYLLLTSRKGRAMLATVQTIIIDEIHALIGNRRGSHLSLSLARLDALCGKPPQRIGLSATVQPLATAAAFLTGADSTGQPKPCQIVASSGHRPLDIAIEIPSSPLEGLISAEVWQEIYQQLAQWIGAHRSTIVFVNSRRLAERLTLRLSEHMPEGSIAAHHGSLAAKLRQRIEEQLRLGELQAIIATSSLELGIDVGAVDLICQIGAVQQISTFLQRAGRACHQVGGIPKARIFPLSRDELVQATALCQAIANQELEHITMEQAPLDVLAQQITAEVGCQNWPETELYQCFRQAMPYAQLPFEQFQQTVQMLQQGFATNQGQRGALLFADSRYGLLAPRKQAHLVALTCGGAIPDQAEYRVVVQPSGQVVGTIHEDYAIDSSIGDIFQLGSTSWRMLGLKGNEVWVEDGGNRSPSVPFWFGEGPGRSPALSYAWHRLCEQFQQQTDDKSWLASLQQSKVLSAAAMLQLTHYLQATKLALGVVPNQNTLVAERFFDTAGGMQLVLHAPLGAYINRAWGLALRKRFCKHFNVELQAAATDNHVLLSLSEVHSFPLESIFQFLSAANVATILTQAVLDSPLFAIRWRWNATRALAIRRRRYGKKTPPHILRMQTEDLLAAVFPDQVACLENIVGQRAIPDHPLVQQTIHDCLHEAMDIEGLQRVLTQIASGAIATIAIDTPEPSPAAHEVLLAKSYAFLDDAPLEERRTRAVNLRRHPQLSDIQQQGPLPPWAVAQVVQAAWPQAFLPVEIHDGLQQLALLHPDDSADPKRAASWGEGLEQLRQTGRAYPCQLSFGTVWVAFERLPLLQALYPHVSSLAACHLPELSQEQALTQLMLQQLQYTGLYSAEALAQRWALPLGAIRSALAAVEQTGAIVQGNLLGDGQVWCERRILARIHRQMVHSQRQQIQAVTIQSYMQFLLHWQGVALNHQRQDKVGLEQVLQQLDGFVAPSSCWEAHLLPARMQAYDGNALTELCLQGQMTWQRVLSTSSQGSNSLTGQTPLRLTSRANQVCWLGNPSPLPPLDLSKLPPAAQQVQTFLAQAGPSFLADIQRHTQLMRQPLEEALAALMGHNLIGCDGFPRHVWQKKPASRLLHGRSRGRAGPMGPFAKTPSSSMQQHTGRWWLRPPAPATLLPEEEEQQALLQAELLLSRWGVVCRRIIQREQYHLPMWRLIQALQRLEDRGQAVGGFFVQGLGGPQFIHKDAIPLLQQYNEPHPNEGQLVLLHSSDPINLTGYVIPGERIPVRLQSKILLRDGLPIGISSRHQWQPLMALERPIHYYVQQWQQQRRANAKPLYQPTPAPSLQDNPPQKSPRSSA